MIRIENPKLLAWFQTPQTVSRPSRPNFQPHRTVDVSNYIQLDVDSSVLNGHRTAHFDFFSIRNDLVSELEIGSGRSGNGLMCLEPCQKFRKFNSDHFPFFKNLYRTSASRVSLPWLEIGSGRSGNGLRCLEPGQNFRKFNSEHFPFLKNFNPTSGSRVSLPAQKNTSRRGGRGGHLPIVNQSQVLFFSSNISQFQTVRYIVQIAQVSKQAQVSTSMASASMVQF